MKGIVLGLTMAGASAMGLVLTNVEAQRPEGKGGRPPRGERRGPPPFELGKVLPPFMIERLELSNEQAKKIQQLEAGVKEKLESILTEDQLQALKDIPPPRPEGGRGGPPPEGRRGGPGGRGSGGPPPEGRRGGRRDFGPGGPPPEGRRGGWWGRGRDCHSPDGRRGGGRDFGRGGPPREGRRDFGPRGRGPRGPSWEGRREFRPGGPPEGRHRGPEDGPPDRPPFERRRPERGDRPPIDGQEPISTPQSSDVFGFLNDWSW